MEGKYSVVHSALTEGSGVGGGMTVTLIMGSDVSLQYVCNDSHSSCQNGTYLATIDWIAGQ